MVAYFFVTQLSLGSVCYLYRLHVFCKIKKIKDKFQTFRKNFLTFHAFSKIFSVIINTWLSSLSVVAKI